MANRVKLGIGQSSESSQNWSQTGNEKNIATASKPLVDCSDSKGAERREKAKLLEETDNIIGGEAA